jgi:ribosome biogenesis GTPase / thiamine phosphate phosphatase
MKSHKEDKIHQSLPKRWVKCEVEEEFFGDDRKRGKMERKLAKAKDRSKYKKTDRPKLEKENTLLEQQYPLSDHLLRGRVLSITPQGFCVEYEGMNFICTLRGSLKKEKNLTKNLVTTGDFVRFEKTTGNEGLIALVEPRRTLLSRADNLSRRKEQLIASNIDQVLITVSVVSPPLKPPIVDRYIIAARKGGMEPVIVVNKIDLLKDEAYDPAFLEQENALFQEFLKAYTQAQIPVVCISATTGQGMNDLKSIMHNKSSVFSGQSGVGKSSLINTIADLDLRTGTIVEKTKKGAHTTTKTQLLPLDFGGWCIDTPGIKSFGIWDLKKDEIEMYFSEIHAIGINCKFPNCSHFHEQECAVMAAVENGEISPLRYESYVVLLETILQEHLRR